jgi:hypothetical protein
LEPPHPAWSPDGGRIVFQGSVGNAFQGPGTPNEVFELFMIRPLYLPGAEDNLLPVAGPGWERAREKHGGVVWREIDLRPTVRICNEGVPLVVSRGAGQRTRVRDPPVLAREGRLCRGWQRRDPPLASSPAGSGDYDRMVPRDRWGMRRAFRTPPGRSAVSWRWEIGLPLFLMGSLTALIAAGAKGGGILFWGGTVVAAVGASICFAGLIGR